MSIRQLTKQSTHFVVRYQCDNKTQVRSRGFVRTDEEITVDGVYEVQWGRKEDVDTAVVLAEGTEKEMKTELRKLQKGPARLPATRKPKTAARPRPPATVISVVSPPGFYPETTVIVSDSSLTVTTVTTTTTSLITATTSSISTPLSATRTGILSPEVTGTLVDTDIVEPIRDPAVSASASVTTSAPVRPSTTNNPSTPRQGFLCRTGRPTGLGPLQSSILSLEASVRSLAAEQVNLRKLIEADRRQRAERDGEMRVMMTLLETVVSKLDAIQTNQAPAPSLPAEDEEDEEVPSEYSISVEDLRDIKVQSSGSGNMAAHIVQRLFPELFGVTNLRYMYSWNGGGHLNKKELCPVRKRVVQKYVYIFYPEVRDPKIWKDVVVPKVNELLRRVSRQERKQKKAEMGATPQDLRDMIPDRLPESSFFSAVQEDFMSYMNL